MKNRALVCDFHPDSEAVYKCRDCSRALCGQCVEQDAILFICGRCGGQAYRLATPQEPASAKEAVASISKEFQSIVLPVLNHIILPAAIILMVGAFLFFLLDVRSIFLGKSLSIMRVSFCFAAATVLIARYGKIYGFRERQKFYTLLLAFVTALVMMRYSSGLQSILINFSVIIAVWWFATRIANSLDIKEEEERKKEKLYGVKRLRMEETTRKLDQLYADRTLKSVRRKIKKKPIIKGKYIHGNPSSEVARFAVIALFVFALGEPFLLSGPPEIGERALMAVIIFLLATGLVLSAGSAAGMLQHTLHSGGKASISTVLAKITTGFVLLAIVLIVSLTIPGIEYRGSGDRIQHRTKEGTEDQKGLERKPDVDSRQSQKTASKSTPGEKSSDGKSQESKGPISGQSRSDSFLNFFSTLGKLLIIPLVLLILGVLIYAGIVLRSYFKEKRWGIKSRLKFLLERLRLLFCQRKTESTREVSTRKNPLKVLNTIHSLSPREAILTAYGCLIELFNLLGHNRPVNNTPHEVLNSLPRRYNFLTGPALELTELYVQTAYGQRTVTPNDRKNALDALFKVKNLIESPKQHKK